MQGWVTTLIQTAKAGFVTIPFFPDTGTIGNGSYQLTTGAGDGTTGGIRQGGKALLSNTLFNGTLLSGFTEISYNTFVPTGSGTVQAPYLNLYVDLDGTNSVLLVFEVDAGTILHDIWQHWDALIPAAFWCTTPAVIGLKTCSTTSGSPNLALAEVVAAYPNAKIADLTGLTPSPSYPFSVGNAGLIFLVGSSTGGTWKNFTGAIDNITIGASGVARNYNFEN